MLFKIVGIKRQDEVLNMPFEIQTLKQPQTQKIKGPGQYEQKIILNLALTDLEIFVLRRV